jgi:hypothetical protein
MRVNPKTEGNQCIDGSAVQPAKKNPAGNKMEPSIIGGRPAESSVCDVSVNDIHGSLKANIRISGRARPPLRSR